jgi:murein DD-endopeptidase MepM/ murein hydrolase activator NlpD
VGTIEKWIGDYTYLCHRSLSHFRMVQKKKEKRFHKLRDKYRLVIFHDETFEEKVSFRLSRMSVFVSLVSLSVVLIVATIYIIAFTPLREYIPGYTDVGLSRQVYELEMTTDSLERVFKQKEIFLANLKRVIDGYDETQDSIDVFQGQSESILFLPDTISLYKSQEDSLLRLEFESARYNLYYDQAQGRPVRRRNVEVTRFFVPLNGTVTSRFNISSGHFGIDIVAKSDEAIKATLDGTVIFADWTLDKGYVIGIQHAGNILSVYKHNAALLKKEGELVKAGEPIAFIGGTGELSTGPHLHFELWHEGAPVNPEEFISF